MTILTYFSRNLQHYPAATDLPDVAVLSDLSDLWPHLNSEHDWDVKTPDNFARYAIIIWAIILSSYYDFLPHLSCHIGTKSRTIMIKPYSMIGWNHSKILFLIKFKNTFSFLDSNFLKLLKKSNWRLVFLEFFFLSFDFALNDQIWRVC